MTFGIEVGCVIVDPNLNQRSYIGYFRLTWLENFNVRPGLHFVTYVIGAMNKPKFRENMNYFWYYIILNQLSSNLQLHILSIIGARE